MGKKNHFHYLVMLGWAYGNSGLPETEHQIRETFPTSLTVLHTPSLAMADPMATKLKAGDSTESAYSPKTR